ncbi:hypothetical protein CERSUDRAFT_96743 [Gelatoporia subvermispora B]|uniref:Uncharacterized protein n=1 Tax=Ceriporiopsis subvermispora (strain B) TaxID=914234 RepID=M2PHR3_CERS8|nr:hypothetical protein CERSUDRAFT_96743 [Gelatoporia subvermispora B]
MSLRLRTLRRRRTGVISWYLVPGTWPWPSAFRPGAYNSDPLSAPRFAPQKLRAQNSKRIPDFRPPDDPLRLQSSLPVFAARPSRFAGSAKRQRTTTRTFSAAGRALGLGSWSSGLGPRSSLHIAGARRAQKVSQSPRHCCPATFVATVFWVAPVSLPARSVYPSAHLHAALAPQRNRSGPPRPVTRALLGTSHAGARVRRPALLSFPPHRESDLAAPEIVQGQGQRTAPNLPRAPDLARLLAASYEHQHLREGRVRESRAAGSEAR